MKVYAQHSSAGDIQALIVFQGPETAGLIPTPAPGSLVSEIAEKIFETETPSFTEISEIARSHRIATPMPRVTLTKKHK